MTTVQKLRKFLQACPLLTVDPDGPDDPVIYVDYLPGHPLTYGINIVPSEPWFRKYVDGGGIRQTIFVFRSLDYYGGADIEQNEDNLSFFEEFAAWLHRTRPNPTEFPGWFKVEALSEGFIFDAPDSQDRATYQIQCRLLYTVG